MSPTNFNDKLEFSYPAHQAQEYKSTEWIERKIIAIPHALISGVVQSIYHLVIGIFKGIGKACGLNIGSPKVDLYRSLRDVQEGFGWIVIIFNDKLGSSIIEDSRFQKEKYSEFETSQTLPLSQEPQEEPEEES